MPYRFVLYRSKNNTRREGSEGLRRRNHGLRRWGKFFISTLVFLSKMLPFDAIFAQQNLSLG